MNPHHNVRSVASRPRNGGQLLSICSVAVEGIEPSVRSRLTTGLIALPPRCVIASPEAPRKFSASECRSREGLSPFLSREVPYRRPPPGCQVGWSRTNLLMRVGLLRLDARSSSRRNRTVTHTGMSRRDTQCGLPKGRASNLGRPVLRGLGECELRIRVHQPCITYR